MERAWVRFLDAVWWGTERGLERMLSSPDLREAVARGSSLRGPGGGRGLLGELGEARGKAPSASQQPRPHLLPCSVQRPLTWPLSPALRERSLETCLCW